MEESLVKWNVIEFAQKYQVGPMPEKRGGEVLETGEDGYEHEVYKDNILVLPTAEKIQAWSELATFFSSHSMTVTKSEILEFRNSFYKKTAEKRKLGGPYEGFTNAQMYLTVEGIIISELQSLIDSMNVQAFALIDERSSNRPSGK